jgi:hypothetical protein
LFKQHLLVYLRLGGIVQQIPEKLLRQPVQGFNLEAGTLADQLTDQPVLLTFLRHFG